jgi:hypothetical protein
MLLIIRNILTRKITGWFCVVLNSGAIQKRHTFRIDTTILHFRIYNIIDVGFVVSFHFHRITLNRQSESIRVRNVRCFTDWIVKAVDQIRVFMQSVRGIIEIECKPHGNGKIII